MHKYTLLHSEPEFLKSKLDEESEHLVSYRKQRLTIMSKFSSGFIAGIFTGAALGTLVGILYAPEKGAVTRDKLSFKFNSYIGELDGILKNLRSHREELTSDAKTRGNKVVQEAKRQADELIAEAESLMKSAISQTNG